MTLKLRPTCLGSGIDKDGPDYTMYCGEWAVGRIMKAAAKPADSTAAICVTRRRQSKRWRTPVAPLSPLTSSN